MAPRYHLAVLLFTDVVGSTELRQRLGHDQAEEHRSIVDRIQLDVIAGHDGEVIKHLGDGLMATFGSATNAVNAAITLQSELARVSHRLAEPVQLRIGLAAGEVSIDANDRFGMPVVVAARLCALAEGGTVLVDDLARRLVAGVTAVPFEHRRELELKGVDGTVTAWSLEPDVAAGPPPLPAALRGDARFVFVGREAERVVLRDAWEQAAAGHRQLVMVAGEPGVGKTRLLAQLAEVVRAGGGVVVYGRDDPDLVVPYQPFAEAIRQYVAHQPRSLVTGRLGPFAADLARLVPDLSGVLGEAPSARGSDAEAERLRLFEAVAQWLATASAATPMLVVLDDLHWAAEQTIQLLRYVARSAVPMSVMFAMTSRDESPEGFSAEQLLARLSGVAVQEVRLSVFDDATTLAFIEAAARHPFGPEGLALATLVCEQTGGNALFTRELLLHLSETGVLTQVDGRWSARTDLLEAGVPDGIRRVVTERLGRLSGAAQQMLQWAAVIGQSVDGVLLAQVSDLSEPVLLDALDECCGARLLNEDAAHRYLFPHALVRSSLYQALGPTRRAHLHRRVAEALESLTGDDPTPRITELAYHAAQGAAVGFEAEAVRYCTLAGDRALEQLAASDAARYYRTALDVLDRSADADPARRCDLLTGLGRALLQAGDAGFASVLDAAAASARALADAERFGAVVLAASRGSASTSGSVDAGRVAIIDEALALLDPADSPLRARLLGALAAELHFGGVTPRVVELSHSAVDMARRLGDVATVAFTLVQRAAALRSPDHLDQRRADLTELTDLCRQLGDPVTELLTASRLAEVAFESARYDEVVDAIDRSEQLLARLGHSYLELRVLRTQAELAMLRGQVATSERLLESMIELADKLGLERQAFAGYVGNITKVRAAQGRSAETIDVWRRAAASLGPTYLPGLAVLLADAGELDEAGSIYQRLATDGFESVTRDSTWVHNLCFLTMLCRRFGTAGEAAQLEAMLTPYAELVAYCGAGSYGAVAHFLGLLSMIQGDVERADWWLDKAVPINASMHAPLLQASTLLARADLLTQRDHPGDADRATLLRAEAAEIARSHGAAGLELESRKGRRPSRTGGLR
jgi:class 3 adenylate cyclase/tetratricopeptide (TPR) repeat protein